MIGVAHYHLMIRLKKKALVSCIKIFITCLIGANFTDNTFNRLDIDLTYDSTLRPMAYSYRDQSIDFYTTTFRLKFDTPDGKEYVNVTDDDSVIISFTSIANGLASGTFKAALTNP